MSDALVSDLYAGKQRFLELVADVRPELHRYCARMTGSVADGEDVVQDALANAYYALSEMTTLPNLRPWLFAIAHRKALDHLRRYDRKYGSTLDDSHIDESPSAEDLLAKDEATKLAIGRFCELPPSQRSVVILKDVLGHSLEEIAALSNLSLPAVKSVLHRGRESLRMLGPAPEEPPAPAASPAIAKYVALFNARDWDALRAMLADDVKLDLVARAQRRGRTQVGEYFTRYDMGHDWRLVPGVFEGREVVFVHRPVDAPAPAYFIELGFDPSGHLERIKDFRYVPYLLDER